MTDQNSVEAKKAASAAGAVDNSDVGVDGDDPSVADRETGAADPVSAETDDAVGEGQAAEDRHRDPSS